MAGELMDALNQVARETDLSGDVLLDLLKKALVSAYRKKYKVEGEIGFGAVVGALEQLASAAVADAGACGGGELGVPGSAAAAACATAGQAA